MHCILYSSFVLSTQNLSVPVYANPNFSAVRAPIMPILQYQPTCVAGSNLQEKCGMISGPKIRDGSAADFMSSLKVGDDEKPLELEKCREDGRIKKGVLTGILAQNDEGPETLDAFCECAWETVLHKFSAIHPKYYLVGCKSLSVLAETDDEGQNEKRMIVVNKILDLLEELRVDIGSEYVYYTAILRCEYFSPSGIKKEGSIQDSVEGRLEKVWEQVNEYIRKTSTAVDKLVAGFSNSTESASCYEHMNSYIRTMIHDKIVRDIETFIGSGEDYREPVVGEDDITSNTASSYSVRALTASLLSSYVFSSFFFVYNRMF